MVMAVTPLDLTPSDGMNITMASSIVATSW